VADSDAPDNGPEKKTEVAILEPAAGSMLVPAMVAAEGERAAFRFIDFFTANIRNANTRAAYAVAARGFFTWLDQHEIRELGAIRTHHVSAYIEYAQQMAAHESARTTKLYDRRNDQVTLDQVERIVL
jgi:hypothetical protein